MPSIAAEGADRSFVKNRRTTLHSTDRTNGEDSETQKRYGNSYRTISKATSSAAGVDELQLPLTEGMQKVWVVARIRATVVGPQKYPSKMNGVKSVQYQLNVL